MIIFVNDALLTTIAKLESMESFRSRNSDITFCWTYAPNGTSADGLAFKDEAPFKHYDVAVLSNGEQMILERPVYSDFEIQWREHPMNTVIM